MSKGEIIKDHDGRHLKCEECLEREKAWSSKTGEALALERVITLLAQHASIAFLRGEDTSAMMLRAVTNEVDDWRKVASKELQTFIDAQVEAKRKR